MRSKTKNILIFTAIALIFVMLAGVFAKLNNMETEKNVGSSAYSVGAISVDTGKNVESKMSIYMKDMQELDGAEIKLEDDAQISYNIYFYNEEKVFISATQNLTSDFDNSTAPEGAVYFKVQITPNTVDGEAVEVSIFNVSKYAKQLNIVVAK